MKLKTKLSLAFGLFFVALLLLAFLGANGIFRQNNATEVILKDNYESLDYAQEMLKALEVHDFDKFLQNLEKQQANITEIGEREITESISENLDSLRGAGAGPAGRRFEAGIRENLHQIWDINQEAILRKSDNARLMGERAFQIIAILSTLVVVLAFSFLVNLPSYISRPLAELRDGIRQILQRDYTARVEVRSRDELGELGGAFNEMAQKLDFWEHSNWAQVLFEKKRIETIIEQMQDAIIGLDERQQILFINPVMEKLLGIAAKDAVGKNALELALRNDLLRHLLRPPAENATKSDLKIFYEGREGFFNQEKYEVHNGAEAIGQVIVLKNVTAFKELDLAKTNFIATISHELKTPIAAIKMSLKLLEDERVGNLNPEQQKLVAQIRDDSERLLRITGELLDLTQVETGNMRLTIAPTRVDYLVGYAAKAVEPALREKNLRLDLDIAEGLPTLQLDTEKTAWVLVNLLANAVKYSPENDRIVVQVNRDNGHVVVSVRDNGRGIDEKYKAHLFEKFFQAPNASLPAGDAASRTSAGLGGTGLGLAIAKDFIEAQGGRIWVDSKVGEGATFSFSLPVNV